MSDDNLCIKVPVYLTTPREISEDEMFGGTFEEMIQNLKDLLDDFHQVTKHFRNKTKRTVIKDVNYFDYDIKGKKALLLRINAYSTNMRDGYFESGFQREDIGISGKVGSDTNFVLMYPHIEGIHPDSRSCSYYMLVYEDPTKDPGSVSYLAKTLAKDILHQPVHHIKPESIMESVKKIGTLPELHITYVGVSFDDDGDSKYNTYRSSVKIKATKEEIFKNVPGIEVEDLTNKQVDTSRYQKRYVRLVQGRKTFKIAKDISEAVVDAKEKMNETAEMVYNMTSSVTAEELQAKIHDQDFVVSKLAGVLDNILGYGV